jgi:hypothetical protein
VAREMWAWALRRWDKLDWLPDSDAELLEWWTICETCGKLSSSFSGASGGTEMTWSSTKLPPRSGPLGRTSRRSTICGV